MRRKNTLASPTPQTTFVTKHAPTEKSSGATTAGTQKTTATTRTEKPPTFQLSVCRH